MITSTNVENNTRYIYNIIINFDQIKCEVLGKRDAQDNWFPKDYWAILNKMALTYVKDAY